MGITGFDYRDGIITERLRLVRFTEAHITERYLSWLHDKDLLRYSDQRFRTHTRESCMAYQKSFERSPNAFLAVEDRSGELGCIGTMTAYIDLNNGRADMGILIGHERARGNGYGLEAWVGLMGALFERTPIRKITAGTLSINKPMLAVAKRANMIADGIRSRQNLVDGKEVDILHFAAFRGEWVPPV